MKKKINFSTGPPNVHMKEQAEYTKGVTGIRKSKKHSHHNGQKKKDKNDLQNIQINLVTSHAWEKDRGVFTDIP